MSVPVPATSTTPPQNNGDLIVVGRSDSIEGECCRHPHGDSSPDVSERGVLIVLDCAASVVTGNENGGGALGERSSANKVYRPLDRER